MKVWNAAVALLAVAAAALSGCTSDSGSTGTDAIAIENLGEPGGPGPYRFTAKVSSEDGTYAWDLGDRLTTAKGETVEHTYDFKDSAPDPSGRPGNVTVTLRVVEGGAAKAYTASLRIGSGQNQSPAFALDAQTNWAVVGETVRFSAARSADPDGDALRYSWACLVITPDEKLVKQPVHSHGGVAAYKPPSAGTVTSYLANATLPAPTKAISGDLCEALGASGTTPAKDASVIEGAFTKRGKYKVVLVGSDGPHSSVSGSFDVFVTRADERPAPWQHVYLNATLQGGGGGQLQPVCSQLPVPDKPTCDTVSTTFELPLPGLVGWLNGTYQKHPEGAPADTNAVTWTLHRAEKFVANNAEGDSIAIQPAQLTPNSYTLTATLTQGASSVVSVHVAVRLNLDPLMLY